jgi:hypothetical protein
MWSIIICVNIVCFPYLTHPLPATIISLSLLSLLTFYQGGLAFTFAHKNPDGRCFAQFYETHCNFGHHSFILPVSVVQTFTHFFYILFIYLFKLFIFPVLLSFSFSKLKLGSIILFCNFCDCDKSLCQIRSCCTRYTSYPKKRHLERHSCMYIELIQSSTFTLPLY